MQLTRFRNVVAALVPLPGAAPLRGGGGACDSEGENDAHCHAHPLRVSQAPLPWAPSRTTPALASTVSPSRRVKHLLTCPTHSIRLGRSQLGELVAAWVRPGGMRRALIAIGTLGGGTLIAFVFAGLAFLANPDGRHVPVNNAWPVAVKGGPAPLILVDPAGRAPVPMPAMAEPAVAEDAVIVREEGLPPAVPAEIDLQLREEVARSGGG